jgi:hypothetical protein
LVVSAFGWSALGVSGSAPGGSGMKAFSFLIGCQRRMNFI